jgi:hypothetical protein
MTHHDFDPSELLDALRERPDLDLVREMVGFLHQALIDADATGVIGAEPHERSATRTTMNIDVTGQLRNAKVTCCDGA